MSRPDSHGPSRPPGLGHSHSATDLDHPNAAYLPSTSSHHPALLDRRMSHGLAVYPANSATSAIPRYGMHIQDKEFNNLPTSTDGWPAVSNRHTPSFTNPQLQHLSSSNHHRPSPPLPSGTTTAVHAVNPTYYNPSPDVEREGSLLRQPIQSPQDHQLTLSGTPSPPGNPNFNLLLSTLWWGDLEPWMDEEYAKQVCGLMGWDPVSIKVPTGGSDAPSQQANNPGHCFLTFPSPSVAASVLSQVNGHGGAQPVTMPNSNKPFLLNWASSIPSTITPAFPTPGIVASTAQQHYMKEYSIFVGDLAPETSNSDLVAVFRNPVLGLRNDREPKFIRPFLSCKSAKIMLDPVTGVSRGYGFVRFTDEADQQRALIEMHGLYCLSRPMRISPATAKFKPAQVSLDLPLIQFPGGSHGGDPRNSGVTVAMPMPNGNQARSVSSPMAVSGSGGSPSSNSTGTPVGPSGSGSSLSTSGSCSVPSLSSGSTTSVSSGALTSASSDDILSLAPNVLVQVTQQYGGSTSNGNSISSITSGFAQDSHESALPRYMISEESWKHHAQARAILGNLMGPNGEQLTSTDPYNTTVFVGGLSPLISEETLRTFFAPFGDIHYVKVPVGKHCGFVQFVRKADAERAIEKMQGFPIGGSRIRLSWGRSQYKAAQAAAQAAQAAAVQAQFQAQLQAQLASARLSPEQALQLLQKFGVNGMNGGGHEMPAISHAESGGNVVADDKLRPFSTIQSRSEAMNTHSMHESYSGSYPTRSSMGPDQHLIRSQLCSSFSPFSPDPNAFMLGNRRRGSEDLLPADALSQTMNPYPPRFDSTVLDGKTATNDRPNGPARTPGGSHQYGPYHDNSNRLLDTSRSASRQEPISRPNSSETSSRRCLSSHEEHEHIHDLNGTLASLDLDHQSPWKSTGEPTERKAPSS
ncbi:RNA-binding domain-containing protein [Gyrodon lividus]|nr:RNA-binding domain-containing protein [Gyrodon lividus]